MANELFKVWLEGLFRWEWACCVQAKAVGRTWLHPDMLRPAAGTHVPDTGTTAAVFPAFRPCSFPVAIPGTAFARGMKARAALMRRIHTSLDLLEARKAQQAQQEQNGAATPAANGHNSAAENGTANGSTAYWPGEQLTALDMLMRSRDENDKGLSR